LATEKRRKSLKKMFLMVKTFLKTFFSPGNFFIAIFFGGEQFLPNFQLYSNRPFYTKACCQKSEGVLGRLFLATRPVLRGKYNKICILHSAYCSTAVCPPPLPWSWQGPMGRLWRAVAHLFFNRFK
jgi:hypothetical protein